MPNPSTNDLSHVYWIGGSTFSGKSSVTDRLQATYGCDVFHCDDAFSAHVERIDPDRHPTFNMIVNKIGGDVFLLPPDVLLAGVRSLSREEFEMFITDLRALPAQAPIIAEGAQWLPECLARVLDNPQRTIWLVATASFIRGGYEKAREELTETILAPYKDKERAWKNWIDRDVAFAEWVGPQAQAHGFQTITVDGARNLDQVTAQVEAHFGLAAGEAVR